MRVSRRKFFERLRDAAEGPQRWREKRVAQLKEYALSKAPPEWTAEQREQAAKAVENRLVYMSDDSLHGPDMRRYVESILQSKDIFLNSSQPEEDYSRDSYSDDYYSG
jgi:hypothetical protein